MKLKTQAVSEKDVKYIKGLYPGMSFHLALSRFIEDYEKIECNLKMLKKVFLEDD